MEGIDEFYGVMRTGGSGMTAQSNKLSTVADNIANVNTTGYKRASTEFSSLILRSGTGSYNSGSVETHVRYAISDPGTLQYTTSATDLAIQGNGFFAVTDARGTAFLTRAGSFVPDGQGDLVNAAGFYLMGYNLANGPPAVVANGLTGLEVVNIGQTALEGNPSTQATASVNLDANAAITAGVPAYTSKTSLVTYDNIGNKVTLDIYMSKTAANTWDVRVYNSADSTAGGFPYSSAALDSDTFIFDVSATGKGRLDAASPTSLGFTISGWFALHARSLQHDAGRRRLPVHQADCRRQRAKRHRESGGRYRWHDVRDLHRRNAACEVSHSARDGAKPGQSFSGSG